MVDSKNSINLLLSKVYFAPLTLEDIEEVRLWRNNPKINNFIINKNHITAAQQLKWFDNLGENQKYYFIAKVDQEKLGLFYATQVDLGQKSCEPNGFMGNPTYFKSPIAGLIIVEFFKKLFLELDFETLNGKVVRDNVSFIQLHALLGAEISEDESKNLSYITLDKARFNETITKLLNCDKN